jgi:serine/alanine adding enzyme
VSASFDIREADAGDAIGWDAFVRQHPRSSAYHLYGWRRVFSRGLKAPARYLVATDRKKTVVGLLPLVHLRSPWFGNFLVSVPYANFGGALSDSVDIENALMRSSGQLAKELGASHVEFRDTTQRCDEWPVRLDKVEMIRRLESDPEELTRNLGGKLRAQAKRPLREGATLARGRHELLDEFYSVFSVNMRDLGTPSHAKSFFGLILDCMAPAAELLVVRLGDKPVAAGLLVHHGKRTEIPSASSLREFNRYGVNMYLYSECLKAAIERGSTEFDFGRSSPDSGTYRFKKQWGAEPQQLYWHYWLRDGAEPPNLSPSNPKYELAIKVWQHLPLWLTNRLGPAIVRKLP